MPALKHIFKDDLMYHSKSACVKVRQWCLRLREVVSDEVRALEEQKNVAEAVTLQGTVQRDPVSILESTQTRARIQQK